MEFTITTVRLLSPQFIHCFVKCDGGGGGGGVLCKLNVNVDWSFIAKFSVYLLAYHKTEDISTTTAIVAQLYLSFLKRWYNLARAMAILASLCFSGTLDS